MWGYLTDMIFAQIYAKENRRLIMESVLASIKRRGYSYIHINTIESIHNYINFEDFIIRKGAISSYNNQLMIIPLNMEDGILICKGKSNPEWNYSAPHGAGRISSRSEARKKINNSSEIARSRMENKGIYASIIPTDETKDAYKDPKLIENDIKPTAKIVDRIIPVMNLKAGS
jgi:tRNA-splicing ligase RtcB (3'-phosphate/5'-hydroxy nucleic acid ligase)